MSGTSGYIEQLTVTSWSPNSKLSYPTNCHRRGISISNGGDLTEVVFVHRIGVRDEGHPDVLLILRRMIAELRDDAVPNHYCWGDSSGAILDQEWSSRGPVDDAAIDPVESWPGSEAGPLGGPHPGAKKRDGRTPSRTIGHQTASPRDALTHLATPSVKDDTRYLTRTKESRSGTKARTAATRAGGQR